MGVTRISVHIDRLVLTGVDPADRRAVADGLQRALAEALAAPDGAPGLSELASVSRLRAGTVTVAPGTRAGRLGTEVGAHIGKVLTP